LTKRARPGITSALDSGSPEKEEIMRKKVWLALLLLPACGCATNAQTDALAGGGAGAVAGGLLSHGNPVAMAAGGLLGAGVGSIIGSSQDKAEHDKKIAQAQANAAAYAAANQMTLQQIVQMSQGGISDTVIIRQMDATGSVFNLRPEDIQYLHDQRVSDQVISAMLARRSPRAVVVGPPPVYYAPPPPGTVVVVDPGPPPPPIGVGVGVGIGGHWR
jgi:hypothetical protein